MSDLLTNQPTIESLKAEIKFLDDHLQQGLQREKRMREALLFIRKCAQVALPESVQTAITDAVDEALHPTEPQP